MHETYYLTNVSDASLRDTASYYNLCFCKAAGLGQDNLIMRPSIWAAKSARITTWAFFSFFGHFSILILNVSILTLKVPIFKIDTFKVKIDKAKKLKCCYTRELNRSKLTIS